MARPQVIAGEVVGRWTVLTPATSCRTYADGKSYSLALCRCECGAEAEVLHTNLASGSSDGCRRCAFVDMHVRQGETLRRMALRDAERDREQVRQLPEPTAAPSASTGVAFHVGDDVRVRGARCVVVKVGPEGVMVRGPRCPAGWLPADEVEEAS